MAGPAPAFRADPRDPPTIRDVTDPLPDLVLYARAGCHLCEQTRAVLEALLRDRGARGLATPRLVERDIDADPALHDRYDVRVPVARIGNVELDWPFTESEARQALTALAQG